MADQRKFNVVRVKLGPDKAAPQPDALGRPRIGYAPGLGAADLWDRGRGLWRARLEKVADAQLLLITAAGTVVMVGTVTGVTFHDGRIAITGTPAPAHPLIGQPDPLVNSSANPVAYGTLETVPAAPSTQRAFSEVLSDAVAILTEAGRRRLPRLHQTPGGKVEPHPTDTDPADWAEFVTVALAGAAANLGGIDAALAGRPGSWEAAKVEDLLYSTVGDDQAGLWSHRTEPVRVHVNVDQLISDRTDAWAQYDDAEQEIDAHQTAAEAADPYPETAPYGWDYTVTGPNELVAVDPAAPEWSWEAWRTYVGAQWPEFAEQIEREVRNGDSWASALFIPRSPEAGAEYNRLNAERDARIGVFSKQLEELEAQKEREWEAYGSALAQSIETAARNLHRLRIPIEVTITTGAQWTDDDQDLDPLAAQLLEAAVAVTPSPADLPGTPLDRLNQGTSS
jgi:hypothetical protein